VAKVTTMTRLKQLLAIACLATLGLGETAGAQSRQAASGPSVDDLLAIQVYAVGGGFFPLGASGNVGAVDMTDPTNTLVSSQSGGGSSATLLLGARVHFPFLWYMRDEQSLGYIFFFEAGIQSGFGKQSFIQSFQGTSPNALDFGTSTVSEFFQVPLLLGVTVPMGGRDSSHNVLLDFYGGLTIDSWALVLQGAENNAPGQQGFYGQNRLFTFDPTLGVGIRVPVGELDSSLPLFFGLNAEVQFRPGASVTTLSNSFPVSYSSSVGPTTNLAIMARIGVAFGDR
jgi:hypothetical protein